MVLNLRLGHAVQKVYVLFPGISVYDDVLAGCHGEIVLRISNLCKFSAFGMVYGRVLHGTVRMEDYHNADIVGSAVIFNFLYQFSFPVPKYNALFREARREKEITHP